VLDSAPLVWFTVRWWSARQLSPGSTQQGTPVRFRDGPAAVTRRVSTDTSSAIAAGLAAKATSPSPLGFRGEKARSAEPGSQKTYQGARRAVRSCEGRADCEMNRFNDCCAMPCVHALRTIDPFDAIHVCASERMRVTSSSLAIRMRDRCSDLTARPETADGAPCPLV
jgi:hypothetical protein